MRTATEGNLPLVKPQRDPVADLGCELRRLGNGRWTAPLPARGSHHVKQTRACQMRLRTRLPLLTYLLTYLLELYERSRYENRLAHYGQVAEVTIIEG